MLRELITCTPGVSAPAQSRAQSFTWCSPPAPHAQLGSKLGAQSCRTDHIRWFRLVGDPRLFAQPSRDRSTRAYICITPRPVVQTTLGGSDSWAGLVIDIEIWALDAAVQVTLGDSGCQMLWYWYDLYLGTYIHYEALAWHILSMIGTPLSMFGIFIHTYICLFSGKYTGFTARG